MSNHERVCRRVPLCERQELRCEIAKDIAIEGHIVRYPEAVADGEQQQRIFGSLSQRFSLLAQQTCPLLSRLGFCRGRPFDVKEWGYKPNLKHHLLATQCRGA